MPPKETKRLKAVVSGQSEDQGSNQAPTGSPANPGSSSTRSPAQTLQGIIDALNRTPFATSPEVPEELLKDVSPTIESLIVGLHRLAMRTCCAEKALFETGKLPLASPLKLESPIANMEQQVESIARHVHDLSEGTTASRDMLPLIQTKLEYLSQKVTAQSDDNRAVRSQEKLVHDVKGTMASLGADLNHIKKHVESVEEVLQESKDRRIAEAEDTARKLELQLGEAKTEIGDLREMLNDIKENLVASNTMLQASIDRSNDAPKEAPVAHTNSSITAVDEAQLVRKTVDTLVRQSRSFATFITTLFSRTDSDKLLSPARSQSDVNFQTLPEIWHLGTERALALKTRNQELEGDKLRLKNEVRSFQFVLRQIQKGFFSLDEWQTAADDAEFSEELDLTAAVDLVDIARMLQSYRSKLRMQVQSRRWSPRPTPSWIPIAH